MITRCPNHPLIPDPGCAICNTLRAKAWPVKLIAVGREVGVASLMQELTDPELIRDPNYVKVVVDAAGRALLFSRAPIPYVRDPSARPVFWEHIGVYAFRRDALLRFARLPAGALERAEKVECLRFLEHGIRMRMVATDYMGVEIDTPEDLRRAERLLAGEKG